MQGFSPTEKPVGCKSDTSQLLISSIRHAAGKQIRRGITASETERLAARCVQQQESHGFQTRVLIKCLFFVSKRLEIFWEYSSIQPNRITRKDESPVAIGSWRGKWNQFHLTLILRRSRMGTVWFYTSNSNKRAARSKLYTKSLTGDLKLMYSRFTLVRISINL